MRCRTNQTDRSPACGRWLVLSAWAPELTELRRLLKKKPARKNVMTRIAGVGLVEAAVGATAAIVEVNPDAVIFVGTAGSFPGRRPALVLGGAVAARRLVLWADGVAAGDAYLPPALPVTQVTSLSLRRIATATGLRLADVACPVGITARLARTRRGAHGLACDVENLEAFAVGRAAAVAGLPFATILGISNPVGPSGHAAWKRHATRAAAAACRAALALIEESNPQRGKRG